MSEERKHCTRCGRELVVTISPVRKIDVWLVSVVTLGFRKTSLYCENGKRRMKMNYTCPKFSWSLFNGSHNAYSIMLNQHDE